MYLFISCRCGLILVWKGTRASTAGIPEEENWTRRLCNSVEYCRAWGTVARHYQPKDRDAASLDGNREFKDGSTQEFNQYYFF